MLLYMLAFIGGVLTILSPCILPVLPFVFARADQPFLKSGLPMLLGMALTFAGVASLAAVGGGWAVEANQAGRLAALALLALFGVTLLLPGLADRLSRPLVALGARLSQSADARVAGAAGSAVLPSVLLGIATGAIALDRFFGYSSGWMRYITTALALEKSLSEFRLEWTRHIARLRGGPPAEPQLDQLILTCERFSLAVRSQVEQETNAWVIEFQSNLSHLERELQCRADEARSGNRANG